MPAQSGNAILLQYRAQPPAAQSGNAILLDSQPTAATRTARAGVVVPWAVAAPLAADVRAVMEPTAPRDVAAAAPWAAGQRCDSRTGAWWGVATAADRSALAPWGAFDRRHAADLAAPWGVAVTADRATRAPWSRYGAHPAHSAAVPWGVARAADRAGVAPWGVYAALALGLAVPLGNATPADRLSVIPWLRYSRQLNPGWGVVVEPGGPPVDDNGTVIVPILEHYLVINTVTLVRADTGEPVEVANLSASLDRESWCWGWSANLAADQLDLVRSPALGEHVELIATFNGISLRLVVERIARNRQFPTATLRIGGRGRAAWLAAPHSPVQTRYNTEARTAQQLANDALTYNGVPIGWSVDWRLTDWLVPAGAWSHRGTYMEAVQRIADAGGGYVQAHNTDQQLIIQPHYPTPPWEWASQTPDIELPEDVCEVEDIEQEDKPAYNAVYVIGGTGGRRDRIRRTGTAADVMAPNVVDALATAPEMTRQRGIAVLGDTGRQEHISLRLPVLDETGIILPGTLIKYVEGGAPRVGLSRGVALDHRFPELWQTVRIETHVL